MVIVLTVIATITIIRSTSEGRMRRNQHARSYETSKNFTYLKTERWMMNGRIASFAITRESSKSRWNGLYSAICTVFSRTIDRRKKKIIIKRDRQFFDKRTRYSRNMRKWRKIFAMNAWVQERMPARKRERKCTKVSFVPLIYCKNCKIFVQLRCAIEDVIHTRYMYEEKYK